MNHSDMAYVSCTEHVPICTVAKNGLTAICRQCLQKLLKYQNYYIPLMQNDGQTNNPNLLLLSHFLDSYRIEHKECQSTYQFQR